MVEVITADGRKHRAQACTGHTRRCRLLFSLYYSQPQAQWKLGWEQLQAEERLPFHRTSLAAHNPLSVRDPPWIGLHAEATIEIKWHSFSQEHLGVWPTLLWHHAVLLKCIICCWLLCWRSQSKPSLSSLAKDFVHSNQKTPLIWILFTQLLTMTHMPFHSSSPHAECNQPGPICLYKQEAKAGDVTWPWQFCFLRHCPRPFNRTRLGGELY